MTLADVQRRQVGKPKPSKYRNVKVIVDGQTFDSKREAAYWQGLKARERNGEIQNLRRQVHFPLTTTNEADGIPMVVAIYVADFVFEKNGIRCVLDAKGHRNRLYLLKRKWLWLQSNVAIEEV